MEQTLGKRIVHHRKKLNLTQDQLAEKLGVTAQAVSKWENDQSCPDIAMLPKLAEIFGISIDELLGREAPRPVHTAEVVEEDDADDGIFNIRFDTDDGDGKWAFHWDSGKKNALAFASCILLTGVLTLLSRILAWDVSFWSILWPTFLLVFGIAGLFSRLSVFHLGLSLLGGYFLVSNLGLWQLSMAEELVFPICVVLFGIGLLVDALRKPKKPVFKLHHNKNEEKTCRCDISDDYFTCENNFGDKCYTISVKKLRGGKIENNFGSTTLDLSSVQAVAEGCHIVAESNFGETTLRIPRCFSVRLSPETAFGSVTTTGEADADPIGNIIMSCEANFGNICIEYV